MTCFGPFLPAVTNNVTATKVMLSNGTITDGLSEEYSATGAYLGDLASNIILAHLRPDFASHTLLRKHVHKSFVMVNAHVHECPLPQARNLEEHLSNVASFKRANTSWVLRPYNPTTVVYEGGMYAEVWLTIQDTELAGEQMIEKESVSKLHFAKQVDDGIWVCYRHVSLRGPNFFL